MRIFRSTLLASLLGLALCTSWASAADAHLEGTRAVHRDAERRRPDLITNLSATLVSIWNKAGCSIDPLGRCVPKDESHGLAAQKPVPADEGCRLDPLGCAPSR